MRPSMIASFSILSRTDALTVKLLSCVFVLNEELVRSNVSFMGPKAPDPALTFPPTFLASRSSWPGTASVPQTSLVLLIPLC